MSIVFTFFLSIACTFAEPSVINRKEFTFTMPAGWTEGKSEAGFSLDSSGQFDAPESAYFRVLVQPKTNWLRDTVIGLLVPATPVSKSDLIRDKFLNNTKLILEKTLSDVKLTEIKDWSGHDGKGVIVEGRLYLIFKLRVLLFGFYQADKLCLITEYVGTGDQEKYAKDFELIRKSFSLKPTTANPTIVDKTSFSFRLPPNWKETTVTSELTSTRQATFTGPGAMAFKVVTHFDADKVTADSTYQRLVRQSEAALPDSIKSNIEQWSKYKGKGVTVSGKRDGRAMRTTVFAFKQQDRYCVILEVGATGFFETYAKDWEIIRGSFQIKDDVAKSVDIDREHFSMTLPPKWSIGTWPSKDDKKGTFAFVGPNVIEHFAVQVVSKPATFNDNAHVDYTAMCKKTFATGHKLRSELSKWSNYDGGGVEIDCDKAGTLTRETVFIFERGDLLYLIKESAPIEFHQKHASDFEAIRGSFRAKP